MATFHTPSISDLDGFTVGRDSFLPMSTYNSAEMDDFGFDPPSQQRPPPAVKDEQLYNSTDLGSWPDFGGDPDVKDLSLSGHGYEIDRMIVQSLPNATTAIARYGQVTPTRTNSTTSEDNSLKHEASRRASARKRRANHASDAKATSTRKRRSTKKSAAASSSSDQGDSIEEAKRKASLEKNRLAAAKCRINKKEKTEQLQRDSHEKGLHNAFLKEQVMRMKTEVQHLQAILLAHANCEGCKSPEEIQDHLAALGQEYMANHMLTDAFDDYSSLHINSMCQPPPLAEDYFSSSTSPDEYPAMVPPPLPEFNRSADFEIHSSMSTD